MFLSKEPLKQRPPLKAWQVRALEEFVAGASDRHAVIGGQLLFCFHSGCRWKDSLRIQSIETSEDDESGTYLIISKALTSKTTRTVQMKTQLLPYVCLGMGVFQCSWARKWLDVEQDNLWAKMVCSYLPFQRDWESGGKPLCLLRRLPFT